MTGLSNGADAEYFHMNGNVQAGWYSPAILLDVACNPTYLENVVTRDIVC